MTFIATDVPNQAVVGDPIDQELIVSQEGNVLLTVAPAEVHSLSPYPFYGYPRLPPTSYVGLMEYGKHEMLVGIDRFFDSKLKDWRKHKYINNNRSSPDTRTILPEHLLYMIEHMHLLRVPTPGDPNEIVFDSLMQRIKEDEEARGYSITADDPVKQIHRSNQVSQRNFAFWRAMIKILSAMI